MPVSVVPSQPALDLGRSSRLSLWHRAALCQPNVGSHAMPRHAL